MLAYTLAVGVATVAVAWLMVKMTRTDEADLRLLLISAAAVAASLAVVMALRSGRGSRPPRR